MAGMARAMGATLTGAQKLYGKNIIWDYSFSNLYPAPHATIKQQSCINTALSNNAGRVAPAPSISVLWQTNCGIV